MTRVQLTDSVYSDISKDLMKNHNFETLFLAKIANIKLVTKQSIQYESCS